jgi:prepilin-type N-terminal cleavage/methylation domain-containing protein/prepilin-type processing-associated H-X9-DG protein
MVKKKNKSGFTLIELLVVISIIALLVSILLPALSGARDQAKSAVCKVHLSGSGKAAMMYSMDYKDSLPLPPVYREPNPPVSIYNYFCSGADNYACYFNYMELPYHGANAGPCHLGYLFLAGILEHDTNLVYCPNYRGPSFGSSDGTKHSGKDSDYRNSKGDKTHDAYVGVGASPSTHEPYHMTPADEAKIGWMNASCSLSTRNMHSRGWTKIDKGKSRSYMSDVWMAGFDGGSWWILNIADASHVDQSLSTAKFNAFYLDGHVETRSFDREKYFARNSIFTGINGGYMGNNNYPLTWSILFDDEVPPIVKP